MRVQCEPLVAALQDEDSTSDGMQYGHSEN